VVADDTLPTPQTSYGTQKLMCEQLIADCTRKGFIDGRAARLMTVTVRPGKPNAAASSFFSGIIREPLAGVESICPVDASVSHPVSSPARTVDGLIAVYEASRDALGGRLALNLPALNVTVREIAGRARGRRRTGGARARSLRARRSHRRHRRQLAQGRQRGACREAGLTPEASFADIVRQYIADCRARPDADITLKGLAS